MRGRFRGAPSGPSRTKQRAAWALACGSAGNLFFRYLRAGKGLPRVRAFSERNLFFNAEKVDDEWIEMCDFGSRDAQSRFATYSYLTGTIPGGAWRDDRAPLLKGLEVPCQLLRGGGIDGTEERLKALMEAVPQPSCCELIPQGRSVSQGRLYICIYIYMYIYVCVCVCIYIHIYIYPRAVNSSRRGGR